MDKEELVLVWRASGQANAEMIKMYLESFGIQVIIYGESVGSAYGLTSTPLGEVELLVPKSQSQDAMHHLEEINESSDLDLNGD